MARSVFSLQVGLRVKELLRHHVQERILPGLLTAEPGSGTTLLPSLRFG